MNYVSADIWNEIMALGILIAKAPKCSPAEKAILDRIAFLNLMHNSRN